MYELTIVSDFSAAHHLPGYPGKCSRLHGHNWQVEVAIGADRLNELGMVMDFRQLKDEVAAVISTLDHQFLNELAPFHVASPTSEHIARIIFDALAIRSAFSTEVKVISVKVWESLCSSVLYRP